MSRENFENVLRAVNEGTQEKRAQVHNVLAWSSLFGIQAVDAKNRVPELELPMWTILFSFGKSSEVGSFLQECVNEGVGFEYQTSEGFNMMYVYNRINLYDHEHVGDVCDVVNRLYAEAVALDCDMDDIACIEIPNSLGSPCIVKTVHGEAVQIPVEEVTDSRVHFNNGRS